MAAALVLAVSWLGSRTSSGVGGDSSASPSEVARSEAPTATWTLIVTIETRSL